MSMYRMRTAVTARVLYWNSLYIRNHTWCCRALYSGVVGHYIVDLQINISEWIFYKCGDNKWYAINGIAINVRALLLYLHMIIHYNNKKIYASIFRKRDLLSAWFDLHSSVVVVFAAVNFSISLFCCCKKGTMTTSRGISVNR